MVIAALIKLLTGGLPILKWIFTLQLFHTVQHHDDTAISYEKYDPYVDIL